MPALAPGTRIDRYVVEEHLGSGGFGAVHRARHAVLSHPVALKLLHREHAGSEELVARFFQEARAATAIGSPHIVRILDCGTSPEGQPFLAMELLEGQPLDVLLRHGPISVDRAVGIALQVLEGLGAAHAAGIVHRDLKPANVFVTADDGGDFVKLLDFGISKVRTPDAIRAATRSGIVMGTPSYMAPEQFRGARDVDRRADLYSASVVLYEMLSGRAPHSGRSYEDLVVRVCTERPRPIVEVAPSVPSLVSGVVDRGLARDPDARWQSAAELARALRSALGVGVPPIAAARTAPQPEVRAPSPPSVTPRPAVVSTAGLGDGPGASPRPVLGRPRWLAVAAGALAVALIAVVAVAFLFDRGAAPPDAARAADPPAALPQSAQTPSARSAAAADPRVQTPATLASIVPKPRPPKDPPGDSPAARELPAGPPENAMPAPRSEAPLRPAESPGPGAGDGQPVTGAAPGLALVPRVVGQLDEERVRQVLSRARGRLAGCAPPGRSVRVEVQIHLALGEVRLALPAPDNSGPADVARCVASRIGQAFPPSFEPEGSGIVFVAVTLPPG